MSTKLQKKTIYTLYSVLVIGLGLLIGTFTFTSSPKKDVSEIFLQTFPNLEGETIALGDHRGSRFTIINFWATWCAPCVEEMPMFSDFHSENETKGIKVIALAVDNKKQILTFLKKKELNQPILIVGPEGSDLASFLGSERNALPFTALIGPNNNLLKTKMGKISENEVKSWVFDEFKEHLKEIK
tara:strand:+ start:921 stop:1475 length:555 start_codon:yes stop_codon:yes gene_type:complete